MDTNDKQSAASPSGAGIEWRREDAVATVTIANPGHHNAITIEMWRLLKKCFQEIAGSPGLRVVVMSGAQGAFAAGVQAPSGPSRSFTPIRVQGKPTVWKGTLSLPMNWT
jgi:1,4-dihydroxy-2-naphthoyl-CoA synthase